MGLLQIPESASTVEVSIIDTTARLGDIPVAFFAGPDIKGFEKFTACAFAFLVTHTDKETGKQRRIVFDLGPPKDWENDLPEPLVNQLRVWGATFDISKYVSEILEENGVPLDSIEAVIWSHAHWDHVGRVSLFPSSVELITGPGIKGEMYPGYPANPKAPILARDFADRIVTELDFTTSSLTIGQFKTIDFFGDGSFYLFSAPGHAIGHVNALARTSAAQGPDSNSSFILMGADSYHHSSQLRPSRHVPLPDNIPEPLPSFAQYANICPGHIFDAIHPGNPHRKEEIPARYVSEIDAYHNDPKNTPFFTISCAEDGKSVAVDITAARNVIKGLQEFDADDDVLLVSAHDYSLLDVLEYFPKVANDWKSKGWKGKGRWRFLDDFSEAVGIANSAV